jgi:hypothetical protein
VALITVDHGTMPFYSLFCLVDCWLLLLLTHAIDHEPPFHVSSLLSPNMLLPLLLLTMTQYLSHYIPFGGLFTISLLVAVASCVDNNAGADAI